MSNNNNDHLIKHDRRSRRFKRRLKPSMVHDPNGSRSTFRQFYQSGGRDYEQYRLWLQTLSKSEQLSTSSTPSMDSGKIKAEPSDIGSDGVTILPHSPPLSVYSQQPLPIPRVTYTHLLLKPVRPLTIPIKPQFTLPLPTSSSSPLTTTLFKPQVHNPPDYSEVPNVSISSFSSSPLSNWSVADVGRFIKKNFPDQNIAEKFIQQKIDGHTLPLLTEDHLRRIFKMKLGPALHLLALISNIQMRH